MRNRIAADNGSPRVLIVEDDVALRQMVAAVAEHTGFAAVQATDGRNALSLLDTSDYDVLVVDLHMPGINGFDVLRHVAAENPPLLDRTIVITATDERNYRNSPHVRHAHSLLRKPFDVTRLQDEIRECGFPKPGH